jgi:hypothetical protein
VIEYHKGKEAKMGDADTGQSIEAIIDEYAEQLLRAKGLDLLQGETREKAKKETSDLFIQYLNTYVVSALPEPQLAQVRAVIERTDNQEEIGGVIDKMIAEANLDTEKLTQEATEEFTKIYLGGS